MEKSAGEKEKSRKREEALEKCTKRFGKLWGFPYTIWTIDTIKGIYSVNTGPWTDQPPMAQPCFGCVKKIQIVHRIHSIPERRMKGSGPDGRKEKREKMAETML